MFEKKTLRDVDVENQIVLVRTDYNVPLELNEDGKTQTVVSDFRIRASLPTIKYLLEHQAAKIILISHLGRPAGKDQLLTLRPVAEVLAGLLPGIPVNFVDESTGPEVEQAIEELPEGGIILLENLRFNDGEKANDADFAAALVASTHATLFVQDGFAVTHRAHASTSAITKLLPSVAGMLLEKEVNLLRSTLQSPKHPFVVIIGGAKVSDKQPLIEQFTPIADQILVGGKIAADGYHSDNAKVMVADDFDENAAGEKLDIGPVSLTNFMTQLESAQMVLWNGVLGKTEDPAYSTSSTIIAKYLGEHPQITSIICGGDTAGFVEELINADPNLSFSLISTGGGAALELLSGHSLPGIDGLEDM